MSLKFSLFDQAYDSENIFAKILRGDIPNVTVFENDTVLAFMDIMPRVDGHCLVIPKASVRNIYDCPKDVLSNLIHATQSISIAATRAFHAEGCTIQQFSEAAGGQEVFHLHFHVLPRHEGIEFRPRSMANLDVLKDHAERIKAALEGN